ncbi:MAG: VOC family protein [Polyangiaceae bacterium]
MKISALTLVVLRCADLDRARQFYEALGLVLVAERHGTGPLHYSTCIGGAVLELYPRRNAETRGLRLGFLVSDLASALPMVERAGGKVLRAELDAVPSAVVEDPDGHVLELTQPSS